MMFFNRLLISSLLFVTVILPSNETENTDVIEYCDKVGSNRRLLLVSTLDGRLSALSIDNGGAQKWTVSTEPGPLLSSTIHNTELSENSHLIRIIPSLSGGLYKFDGETIESMPVNTDNLLRSYWDGIDISGGKEIRSYAIDIESGTVLYECSMNECSNWTENTYVNSDLILLRRETQKVRAIEVTSRIERWNYSVGLHNVTITHHGMPQCNIVNNHRNLSIKAVVPKGLLYVTDEDDPNSLQWTYQFDSPIVNVWTLIGSRLTWIDLFKPAPHIVKKDKKTVNPTLYVGVHNEQLYVQEYEPWNHEQFVFDKPRISMKRYRLVPADIENRQEVIALLTDESERNSSTALAMLYDGTEFMKGKGFYLYCAESSGDCQPKRRLAPFAAIFLSSMYYWKEAILLLTITFFLIQYLLPCPNISVFNVSEVTKNLLQRYRKARVTLTEEVEALNPVPEETPAASSFCRTVSVSETEYRSRYEDDFEPILCLGKGGFGVVFKARHKVDAVEYAVKRVTLPNREEARKRVLREVMALAKLEHPHIVRYFQSWQECPPTGWQEQRDQRWKNENEENFWSSDPDISTLSSASRLKSCDNLGSRVNGSVGPSRDAKSDADCSFIQFEREDGEPTAEEQEPINNVDDTFESQQTESTGVEERRRRKSISKVNRTNRVYLYIQMQLCQEESLREWLMNNSNREPAKVLRMFDEIVSAVEYVHNQGLIHRDLKPSNIFFSPDGQIKVGDFGLVTEITEDNDLTNEAYGKVFPDRSRTANVGTELYMSPEQNEGNAYNYKVDIYSLGIILFELLRAFTTEMERRRALIDLKKGKYPENFQTEHEEEFKMLSLMLSKSPDKRPTTYGIRAKPPFNRFRPLTDDQIPEEWYFDLPQKSHNNIIRKKSCPSGSEVV